MNFRTKHILLLLIGIWQLIAYQFSEDILLKTVFLIVGVIAICVSTSAIGLYNYNNGYYKEMK